MSVLNLQGAIGCSDPLNIHSCREVIDEAFQGPNLEAVILNINSCGGSLTQSHLVSSYIQADSSALLHLRGQDRGHSSLVSFAIKTQFKAPKNPFSCLYVSLWHKGTYSRFFWCMEATLML